RPIRSAVTLSRQRPIYLANSKVWVKIWPISRWIRSRCFTRTPAPPGILCKSLVAISESNERNSMADQPYITLILPAYNEAKRIANTISEAKTYFEPRVLSHEIIVSADGDDGTREIVAKMGQSDPA